MPPLTQYTLKQSLASKMIAAVRAVWLTAAGKVALITVGTVIIGSGAFSVYTFTRPTDTDKTNTSLDSANMNQNGSAPGSKTTNSATTATQKPEEKKAAPKTATQPPAAVNGGNASVSTPNSNSNTGGAPASGGGGNTSSPPAFKANCITTPSSCGYPDATNTGVPAGVSLTNSGSITVNQNGTVIDRRNVSGQIIVRANNVTIRNTRITSSDYYPIDYDGGFTGLLVEDTEIIGQGTVVTAGVSFRDYTARRVYVRGTLDGFKADANVLIEDSFVTNLYYDAVNDSHNDGVQTTGGSNVTLRHNTFKLSTTPQASAVIQIGTEWGGNTNWLVTNNLIDGGGWSINSGTSNASMVFTNNRFTRNAGYGPGHETGMTWNGNYYDNDGTTVP